MKWLAVYLTVLSLCAILVMIVVVNAPLIDGVAA